MVKCQESKYYLKSLHEEIDLFDRKLAHLLKYEPFASDAERDGAAHKITVKRAPLAERAKRLAAEGVEFKDTELPRSFRPKTAAPFAAAAEEPAVVVISQPIAAYEAQGSSSSFASISVSLEKCVQDYLAQRRRR